ncbi:predicted protein [Arabidopsis lyrata subsp. lyrata]|uniref:Predicted protein n=1 Tax=Arabidopsis lyrata subsp. lyrata TaxID=81972 RepID=D7MQV9_ARALL|nr:predicted protein [Arabidopsis lyrata subsp. lyrata]
MNTSENNVDDVPPPSKKKTAPESARKEADMSDNESAGLYYSGPSDEDEVICDGGEYDKGPLDSASKQQDKSDTEMTDISEDDKDVFPAEEHKTGDDEDVLPEDETKTGDDQDMLHQEESNVGDDQELFNAPSSPKRGADKLERNAGGAIGVDGNLSSMPSPSSVIVYTVLTELGTSVDVTAGTNVIEVEPMVKADIILGGDNNTIVDEARTTASAPQNLVSLYMLFTYHAMISI